MKKTLLTLLLMSIGIAHADVIAYLPNKNNGKIVLTNSKCSDSTFIAYSTSPNTPTLTGCWGMDDQYVHIFWDKPANELRSYTFVGWEFPEPKQTTPAVKGDM